MNATATIGHNQGPAMTLTERLASDYETITDKVDALAKEADALPRTVASDTAAEPLVDVVRRAKVIGRAAEDARKTEKEPYLQAGRDVDAFFKAFTDRITRIASTLEGRINEWQREKERRRRAALEEEARRQREAERLAREEAERKMREAEAAEKERASTVEQVERLADAVEADQAASLASMKADAAEHRAGASITDLGRVRTASGTASVRSIWSFEVTDPSQVPLEPLRQFIPRADLEKAIAAFVRFGGRDLAGVRIFEDFKTQVR